MPRIKPSILKWARESAGLSLEEAAPKVGINDARGQSGAERLLALETAEGDVSRPVLLKMAKVYRRPLVSFYMRSEEHTSELQSLMRISYAVFCLKKKKKISDNKQTTSSHHSQ